jgi:glycosyltransferase involved in cell wall biosynthesis
VHNNWWLKRAGEVDRVAVRHQWRVPECAPAVLFCAKLQRWKRPQDVLRAFARANVPDAYLVYAGEGPMRHELQAQAATLGVAERVRFLGFANQSQLPAVYRASDLLVLPSEYEPFGVVVNEAMLCGCAVAVSDRVGAGYDLVRPGETGFIFPCGDTDALAQIFRETLPAPARLQQIGAAARRRLESWSPRENIEAMAQAIERAMGFAQNTRWL